MPESGWRHDAEGRPASSILRIAGAGVLRDKSEECLKIRGSGTKRQAFGCARRCAWWVSPRGRTANTRSTCDSRSSTRSRVLVFSVSNGGSSVAQQLVEGVATEETASSHDCGDQPRVRDVVERIGFQQNEDCLRPVVMEQLGDETEKKKEEAGQMPTGQLGCRHHVTVSSHCEEFTW